MKRQLRLGGQIVGHMPLSPEPRSPKESDPPQIQILAWIEFQLADI